jgi:hypothetical protein
VLHKKCFYGEFISPPKFTLPDLHIPTKFEVFRQISVKFSSNFTEIARSLTVLSSLEISLTQVEFVTRK